MSAIIRLLVCGGRNYTDYTQAKRIFDQVARDHGPIEIVIHGAASGADGLAERWAKEVGIATEAYPAEWGNLELPCKVKYTRQGQKYNALAGFKRNQKMLETGRPNLAVALPGGNGTADMVARLIRNGITVIRLV